MQLKNLYNFVPGEKMFFVGAVETYPTDHTSIQYDHKQRRYRQNSKKINMGFRQSDDTKIGSTRLIRQLFFRFEINIYYRRAAYWESLPTIIGQKNGGGVNQNILYTRWEMDGG